MSSIPSKFREYVWLVNTIHKAGKISFAEINERWLETYMSEGVEMSRSSFLRHKNAIEEIFGIFIECDTHNDYKYYIGNAHVLENESIQNWMLSTMSVSSMVSESFALQDRILIQSIPFEGEWLEMVIDAMKKNVKIAIDYKRYVTGEVRHHVFDPYALKMHERRWYILAHFHRQAEDDKPGGDFFGTFSLDRIKHMELTDEKFTIDKDFNASEYFHDCFGIVQGDGTPCMKIRLRAYDLERFYIRDLPVHSSQRIIEETDDYTDFELQMRPTLDFSTFLLSKGNRLEVIEPEWLAQEIYEMHMESAIMYEKNFTDNENDNQ